MSKQFRRRGWRVLDDINVSFPARSRVAILGPRDSGKTTLLKLLCGLEVPTEGWIERRMSVSFPVGMSIRAPKKFSIQQFVDFAARTHSVQSDELTAFIRRTAHVGSDLGRTMDELSNMERRRFNFALGYALPFDCYLFDEAFGGDTKSDIELFAKLFEMRSANAATIFVTRSPQKLQQYYNDETYVYLLHNRKLFYYSDVDEAIAVFKTLPDPSETRAVARAITNSDDD